MKVNNRRNVNEVIKVNLSRKQANNGIGFKKSFLSDHEGNSGTEDSLDKERNYSASASDNDPIIQIEDD